MRAMIAALFLGLALLSAPRAEAQPQTCPPDCDVIPASAWPDHWSLPLGADWPVLAEVAVPSDPSVAPRFRFEELCESPPVPADPRTFAVASRAAAGGPDGQWQLQAQILHWRGETWRGGELANLVFDTAVATLRGCRPSPVVNTAEWDRVAATISGPVIAQVYLLVDPRSSSISELVFTQKPPPVGMPAPWPEVADGQVLDAMAGPLCAAYLGSCG